MNNSSFFYKKTLQTVAVLSILNIFISFFFLLDPVNSDGSYPDEDIKIILSNLPFFSLFFILSMVECAFLKKLDLKIKIINYSNLFFLLVIILLAAINLFQYDGDKYYWLVVFCYCFLSYSLLYIKHIAFVKRKK